MSSLSTPKPSELNNVGVDCLLTGDPILSFKAFQTSIQLYRNQGMECVAASSGSSKGIQQAPSCPIMTDTSVSVSPMMMDPFLSLVSSPDKAVGGRYYLSPIKVPCSSAGSRSSFFSDYDHCNLSICSAISIFNMTVSIQSMSDEQARAASQMEDRESRTMQLYKLCLSLTEAAMQDETLSVPALAVCDLIAMASLHNLVHLKMAQNQDRDAPKLHGDDEASMRIGSLLRMIADVESPSRYSGQPHIASWMQELSGRFGAQAFAILGYIRGGAAPAA